MKKPILYGLIILTIALPVLVIPSLSEIYIYPKITFLSLSAAVLMFLWTLGVRFSPERGSFSSPLFWPLLLFLGLNMLSLLKAGNVYEGIYYVLWLLIYVMLFFLVINNLNLAGMQRVIHWSIIGGVIVSAIGIGQSWGWQISFLPFPVGSTLGTKNMSAQHIILILPLAFIGFFFEKETRKELFYGFCGTVMAIFLIYTKSRGAWVGFIGAFVLMLIVSLKMAHLRDFSRFLQVKRKKMAILSLSASLVIIIGIVVPHFIKMPGAPVKEEFLERFESIFGTASPSARSRLAMAANTLDMIRDHYLLGVGTGNWKFIYPLYSRSRVVDPAFSEKVQPFDAHDDWVQMLAEIGILGLIIFLWLILRAYKIGWKTLADALKNPSGLIRYRGLTVLFLLFSISAVLIDAFFDFPLKHPVPLFYFWVFLGFLQIAGSSPSSALPASRSVTSHLPLPSLPERREEGVKPNFPLFFIFILAIFFIIAFAVLNLFYLKGSYHFQQGINLYKAGEIAESISNAEKATSLAPFDYRYQTGLSVFYYKTKQYDKAALAARIALLYHPNYINAWNNLGLSFMRVGLFLEAEKAFKKVVNIYPDYFFVRLNLGDIYGLMGDLENAEREYRAALSLKPDSQEILLRLKALESLSDNRYFDP